MYRRLELPRPLPPLPERFGIRSREQALRDFKTVLSHLVPGDRYTFGLRSAGLVRPDLAFPAYAGLLPRDGVAPVFNFFDRTGGGRDFRCTVTRSRQRDYRGGRLSYDEHDGTDFVCPPGTPMVAAAPGVLVAVRDTWLRGGLTACVDHGHGVVTQYTHLTSVTAEIGQPVARGEAFALSGTSGFDMTQFFPWIPPHVHFMVWVHGRPVDPYLAPGEPARAGAWAHGNAPECAAGPLAGDARPEEAAAHGVDVGALERVAAQCREPAIAREIAAARGDAGRLAVLEDSLHHDRRAWPDACRDVRFRAQGDPSAVRLTLPLPASLYRAARAADAPWTRPDGAAA